MRNLIERNGVYAVRVQLPADVRESFGKSAVARSLRTRDRNEALERAGPMIADIKRQIEKVRRGGSGRSASGAHGCRLMVATHPTISRLRTWFGEAWHNVEGHVARFRQGDFSEWSLKLVSAAPESPVRY